MRATYWSPPHDGPLEEQLCYDESVARLRVSTVAVVATLATPLVMVAFRRRRVPSAVYAAAITVSTAATMISVLYALAGWSG